MYCVCYNYIACRTEHNETKPLVPASIIMYYLEKVVLNILDHRDECIGVAEFGNNALAQHSVHKLHTTEASGSNQHKEKVFLKGH